MRAWLVVAARSGAAALATTVLGLLVWSVAPALLGWRTDVVMSGSMRPNLRTGDIVLSQPGGTAVRPGQVILFADPGRPGRTLVHRVVERHPDGSLTTRGDANAVPDRLPVPPANVYGIARLRVPWIGLPAYWWGQRQYVPLLATGVLLVLAAGTLIGGRPAPATE